ncbi:telomere repeats-binding bouquet formation protein 2 isoform X1 [Mobula hypostoma]|uniref:telomere repeats-binding bouquet formation protein 2 isoform X1 n=1 Tax=Mobula hypostoma TaxID=723540 RepID=UPI002FC29FC3
MHRSKKAWFSQSVSRHICDLWVNEGGIITNWCSADFLFSSNASHPDTQRIFESLDFVEDRATVFHASYLTACEESGLRDCVAMGHFLLPPASLHEGFISIDELKKYSGNLYDFIPGCAHYSVCRIQRERNIFSVLKSKKRNPSLIHTH